MTRILKVPDDICGDEFNELQKHLATRKDPVQCLLLLAEIGFYAYTEGDGREAEYPPSYDSLSHSSLD